MGTVAAVVVTYCYCNGRSFLLPLTIRTRRLDRTRNGRRRRVSPPTHRAANKRRTGRSVTAVYTQQMHVIEKGREEKGAEDAQKKNKIKGRKYVRVHRRITVVGDDRYTVIYGRTSHAPGGDHLPRTLFDFFLFSPGSPAAATSSAIRTLISVAPVPRSRFSDRGNGAR